MNQRRLWHTRAAGICSNGTMTRLLLVATALAVLATGCSSGGSKPSATATPFASPTTNVQPTASPPTPSPGARDVTMAPDGGLPHGSALLIGTSSFGKGSAGFFRLRKVWQLNSAGATGSTEVIPWNGSPDPNRSNILGVAQSEDGTVLWMSRCAGAGCSTEGPKPGTTTTFLRSLDGGASWQEVLRRDGAWWLRAAVGEKGYALSFDGAGAVLEVPSGDGVTVPAGAEAIYILPYQGKLAWVSQDGRFLIDGAGTAVAPFTIPATLTLTGESARWTTPAAALSAWGLNARYVAIVKDGSATPVAILRMPIGATLAGWLDEDTLVFTADYPGTCTGGNTVGGSLPVLLSIGAATARFVTGPLLNCDSAGGQIVLAAWSGLSGQVHTPGDCLNLRQRPEADAPVLECMADGVLVQVIGKDGVPAGWLPVTAPSGASGWVSDAFVVRQ